MKRIAIIPVLSAGLIAGAALAAAIVTAQGAGEGGGGEGPRLIERPQIMRPGPGGPRHIAPPQPKLDRLEREYAEELRRARQEIAGLRTKLDENGRQVRALLEKAKGLTEAERRELRPEFERLLNQRAELELTIAKRQVEIAQKGFDIAVERLIEAKVELRETEIKHGRRQKWFEGEWGKRLRHRRDERLKERREQTEPLTGEQPRDNGGDDAAGADDAAGGDNAPDDNAPSDKAPSDDAPKTDEPESPGE